MLVQELLEAIVWRWPDFTAFIAGDAQLTYGELETAANQLAHALREAGVRRGDRVAVLLENSLPALIAIFAILKAGGVFVVLHHTVKRDKLARILADAGPVALITDSTRVRDTTDVLAAAESLQTIIWTDNQPLPVHPTLRALDWTDLPQYPAERPVPLGAATDLAMLIYTSGTTGAPKGVMATHQNMLAAINSVNAYLQNTHDDVILNVLPLAFGYGLYQVFLAAQVGARVVLDKSFAFPARTVALLEQERVTALPGVPTLFALLLRYPDLLKRDLASLRYMTNAGAAIPAQHILDLRAALPHVQFFSMYGQTECKRATYLPPDEVDRRPSSVGIAIPGTACYVVGEDGQPVPPGAVGELVVSGPHVMQGYWRAPELTEQRFRPGAQPGERVLYTGDLFRTDDEGFLYFVSRKDDIIKSRGEKVSPREVEEVVVRLAGVAEAAVVGVPDPLLGQAILLQVVAQADATLSVRDIRAHCARTLEDYMLPKYVEIVAELPHTDNGKVDRRRIQAEFAVATISS